MIYLLMKNSTSGSSRNGQVSIGHPGKSLLVLHRKFETGEIDFESWCHFFSDCPIDRIPVCEDCAAFRKCAYGHDLEPMECFSRPNRHHDSI